MYTAYHLPVWDTITTAWEKVSGSKASFWGATLLIILISMAFGLLGALCQYVFSAGEGVIHFISSFINFFLQMGIIYMGIRRAQDLPFSYKDMFYPFRLDLIIKLIGLYILKILIMLPFALVMVITIATGASKGTLVAINTLLALAALYLFVRLTLAAAYLLDRSVGSWQSIVLSFNATRSNFWRLFATFFILGLIYVLGIITLFIGFIWILPLGFILYGLIYKRLSVNAPVA